ncbi:MAG: hypothetical protein Q4C50_11350 [Eubacteriales bacterium]|nr:hypothetical protein [Eubacteriales bacterium]
MLKKNTAVLLLTLFILILTGCGYAAPEKAVRQELELIRKLDESTIKNFVSYEDIRLSNSAPLEVGDEATEAIKLFFKNFQYRIRSSKVSEDETTAVVEVTVTNLDAEKLAKDLCRSMISYSINQEGAGNQDTLASSFALMKECLENNTYPQKSTSATVHLTNENGTWVIQESAQLEDELAGGLVSYLRDPYLLTPDEVLSYTLEPFAGFTAQEWLTYLNLSDIFNTGSSLSGEIDLAVAENIANFFDYEVGKVTQDGDSALAEVTISSFDLPGVLSQCSEALLAYAKTTESIRATDAQLSQKTAELLLEALQNNDSSVSQTITVSLANNGYTWEVLLNDVFADALLGGIDTALETLGSSDAGAADSPTEESAAPDTEIPLS